MSFCYSLNEEEYHGDYATKEEAIAEGFADADGEHQVIWVAETRSAREMLGEQNAGDCITEQISEWLYEEIGEYSENFEPSREQCKELGKIILDWLDMNVGFNCYGVHKPEKIEVPQS